MKSYYPKIKGWLVRGTNIKRNGNKRNWFAECTGRFKRGKAGDRLIEVVDFVRMAEHHDDPRRWVNLESFTGSIGGIELTEGSRVGKLF